MTTQAIEKHHQLKRAHMKPTDQLREEHRVIEIMLNVLERLCERAAAGGAIDAGHLDQMLDFFKLFADTCHHGKEEQVLFPAMEKAGFSREQAPLAVMLSEHAVGRQHVQELAEAALEYKKRNGRDASGIVKPARDYIALLREHIAKEEYIIFPMAEECITGTGERDVLNACNRLELDVIGEGVREKFRAVIQDFQGSYLTSIAGDQSR